MWVGLLTYKIFNNKLEKSNLINEHALNCQPVPLIKTQPFHTHLFSCGSCQFLFLSFSWPEDQGQCENNNKQKYSYNSISKCKRENTGNYFIIWLTLIKGVTELLFFIIPYKQIYTLKEMNNDSTGV